VAPSPASSGTSLTVTSGQGTRFPAVPFNATIWATGEIPVPSNAEIVRVTNIAGDVLTITRAQESTSARSILVGDQIAATITVKTLTDIETAFAGTNGAITGGLITVNSSGISVNLPAYLTTAALSQDSSKYAGINGAITGGSITVNTSGVSVNLPAYLTTAALSQDSSKYAGTNGAITGGSITVNTSGVSVNLPAYLSTQSTQYLALTLGGNTAGTTTFNASNNATLFLHGGNNITLSGNGSSVTISGANAGGAQTGISGIVVSDTTYTSGTVSFSNAGNITISSSVNGATQFIKLSGNAAQTTQSAIKGLGASNTGNTAGNTGLSTGIDWVVAGSNNITISQSTAGGGPNTLWVSGPTVGGAQTGISGIVVSDTTYTSGTVSFSNAGNITISSSVNGATQFIKLSGNAAQTTQSAIKAFGVSNTGSTAGNTGISTGIDWVVAASGNVTASQSTAGGGPNTVWISVPAQSAVPGHALGVSNTGSTAGNTGTGSTGTIVFAASGNITASQSTGAGISTIWYSVPAQTTQSAIEGFGVSNTGNTAGNTGISTGIDFVIAGSGAVTLSQSTAAGRATAWVSVAAQSNQSAIKGFGASNTGNTAGNTGISTGVDWVLAGSTNITVSESTVGGGPNTLWLSVPNVAAGNVTFSAGAASAGLGSVVFSNSNGVSFGLNGSTITASVLAQSNQTIGLYATGNTTQNSSTTLDARTISFNAIGGATWGYSNGSVQVSVPPLSNLTGSSPVSLSSNGSTITISLIQISEWAPDNNGNLATNSTLGQSSLFFYPFDLPYPVSGSRINFFLSVATLSSNVASSGSGSIGLGYALYTRGTGASSERISQLTSYSANLISWTSSSGSRFAATHYNGLSNATSHSTAQTALSTSNASTYPATSLGGFRAVALPLNLSLTPGRYWLGVSQQSTNNAAASFSMAASYLQSTMSNFIAWRAFGANSAASDASVYGISAGLGTYSAQSAAWPNSIALSNSDIKMPPSMTFPYFNISGISTATNVL
jgi:hypothetical protein